MMKLLPKKGIALWLLLNALPCLLLAQTDTTYKVVDTKQTLCYNNSTVTPTPQPGEPFYGQDASYTGSAPSYIDNGNGTVTDRVTGLMWQKSADFDGNGVINYNDKMYCDQALARPRRGLPGT